MDLRDRLTDAERAAYDAAVRRDAEIKRLLDERSTRSDAAAR